ncbi:hypothetical protein ACFXGJ_22225, partial [Rhodococcus sp. NPDC059234]
AQPWTVHADEDGLRLFLDPDRTTAMDVQFRGSYVALGAALYNARVAAAARGVLGPVEYFGDQPMLVAGMTFGTGTDEDLARRVGGMLRRGTNRRAGVPRPVESGVSGALADAAGAEDARLSVVTDRSGIGAAAELFAASDRVRFLDPRLHREMIGELRWPGRDSMDSGIDVRSLELDDADLAALRVLSRPDAMAHLAEWGLGQSLGMRTRERVESSSALVAVVVAGDRPRDFLRGGAAAESVWIAAEEHGLAVQPVSPVFLYGLDATDLGELAPAHAGQLSHGATALRDLFRVAAGEAVALVLRLSHAPRASVRSGRRPLEPERASGGQTG